MNNTLEIITLSLLGLAALAGLVMAICFVALSCAAAKMPVGPDGDEE
jgi:hypothetical protein